MHNTPKAGRLFLYVFIALGLAGAPALSGQERVVSFHQVVEGIKTQLVTVEARFSYTASFELVRKREIVKKKIGNGFFLNPSLILTTRSVVKDSQDIAIITSAGRRIPVKTILLHPFLDLALLKLPVPARIPAGTISGRFDPKERYIIVSLQNGKITYQVSPIKTANNKMVIFRLNPFYGQSGSLIVSTNGEMTGILVGIFNDKASFNPFHGKGLEANRSALLFGYNLAYVMSVMDLFEKDIFSRRMFLGINVTQAKGHIVIKDVIHPSPAYYAGLRVNDRIASINGSDVHSIEDMYNVLYKGDTNSSYRFRVLRGDRPMVKNVTPLFHNETDAINAITLLGVKLLPLNERVKKRYKLSGDIYLVLEIDGASPLQGYLEHMDILVAKDNSVHHIFKTIADNKRLLFQVLRDNKLRSVLYTPRPK